MKKVMLICAPVSSRSGYGDHARASVRSLRAYQEYFEIFISPTNWGKTGWVWEESEEREWVDERIKETKQE